MFCSLNRLFFQLSSCFWLFSLLTVSVKKEVKSWNEFNAAVPLRQRLWAQSRNNSSQVALGSTGRDVLIWLDLTCIHPFTGGESERYYPVNLHKLYVFTHKMTAERQPASSAGRLSERTGVGSTGASAGPQTSSIWTLCSMWNNILYIKQAEESRQFYQVLFVCMSVDVCWQQTIMCIMDVNWSKMH